MEHHIRLAVSDDIARLRELIDTSARHLSIGYYTPAQLDGALGTALGVDTQLIADRTYYVAAAGSEIVACGGWSRRRTLFGSDHVGAEKNDALLDPATEPARIRAFFVHPDWKRKGIAREILVCCEEAALAEGFSRLDLAATLPGVPLYAACGFITIEQFSIPLSNGEILPLHRMSKAIRG